MARSPEDYQLELLALPAPGIAFTRDPDSVLGRLMLALGDGLSRADASCDALLLEGDPRTASAMLGDWEEALGLPDPCVGVIDDTGERRAIAFERHIGDGGQAKGFFVNLAASLGYAITITTHTARFCGRVMGTSYGLTAWQYVWDVHAPAVTVFRRVSGSLMGASYSNFGNEPLQCEIGKYGPAQMLVRFFFGS